MSKKQEHRDDSIEEGIHTLHLWQIQALRDVMFIVTIIFIFWVGYAICGSIFGFSHTVPKDSEPPDQSPPLFRPMSGASPPAVGRGSGGGSQPR